MHRAKLPRSVVLNWGLGNVWRCLVVITEGGGKYYWHLMGRAQGASKHLTVHMSTPQQRVIWPKCQSWWGWETLIHIHQLSPFMMRNSRLRARLTISCKTTWHVGPGLELQQSVSRISTPCWGKDSGRRWLWEKVSWRGKKIQTLSLRNLIFLARGLIFQWTGLVEWTMRQPEAEQDAFF